MELERYVEGCIAAAEFKTERTLVLGPPLLVTFRNLRGSSELDVKERGVYLYWDSNARQLQVSKTIGGTATRLDLDTKTVCNDSRYIGDCHTHPYKRKMGPEARIGPSSGDHEEWWNYPPTKFQNFGIHFVISSATAFLLVTRAKTRYIKVADTSKRLGESYRNVTYDGEALTPINEKAQSDEKFAILMGGNDYNAQQKAISEDKNLKGAPAAFAAANLKMNVELANRLDFEYYVGEMDEGASALRACELALKSNPVYI
jgi:hypothetical protein